MCLCVCVSVCVCLCGLCGCVAVCTQPWSSSATRSAPLPPDRVLEHLQGCTDLPVTELCQQYLEYLVNTQGSLDKRYHSQLAREYLARVLALRASVPEEVASGTHRVRCDPGSEEGMLGVMRGKLIRLLDSSDRYDVRLMLGATSDTTLCVHACVCFGGVVCGVRCVAPVLTRRPWFVWCVQL